MCYSFFTFKSYFNPSTSSTAVSVPMPPSQTSSCHCLLLSQTTRQRYTLQIQRGDLAIKFQKQYADDRPCGNAPATAAVGSFETQHGAAPDVGGMASSAVLLLLVVAGCLLCFAFHCCRAVLFLFFFPAAFFQFFSLHLYFSYIFLLTFFRTFLFFFTANSKVCWLAFLKFLPACLLRSALPRQIALLYK